MTDIDVCPCAHGPVSTRKACADCLLKAALPSLEGVLRQPGLLHADRDGVVVIASDDSVVGAGRFAGGAPLASPHDARICIMTRRVLRRRVDPGLGVLLRRATFGTVLVASFGCDGVQLGELTCPVAQYPAFVAVSQDEHGEEAEWLPLTDVLARGDRALARHVVRLAGRRPPEDRRAIRWMLQPILRPDAS